MICFIHFSHSLEIWYNAGGKYTLNSCRMDLQVYRPTSYLGEKAVQGVLCLQGRSCAHKCPPSCAEICVDKSLTWRLKVSASCLCEFFNLEVSVLRKLDSFKGVELYFCVNSETVVSFKQM